MSLSSTTVPATQTQTQTSDSDSDTDTQSLSQMQEKLRRMQETLGGPNQKRDVDMDKDKQQHSGPAQTAQAERPLHVVFLHLDLGIGGAEQLVLQLATASQDLGHRVDLVTTRCDPGHCFAAVKPHTGRLHPNLQVWGRWIPAHISGYGQAVCSTIRLLYLAYHVARNKESPPPDIIVLDVLPTPLPFLAAFTNASLLFYCHFPDKLLTRRKPNTKPNNTNNTNTNNNAQTAQAQQQQQPSPSSQLKQLYRSVMDGLEEWSIQSADVCAVNSQFTRATVLNTFPTLSHRFHDRLPVLYPALDTSVLDAHNDDHDHDDRETKDKDETDHPNKKSAAAAAAALPPPPAVFVSLNRYERKKNLGLLLEAAAWLKQHRSDLTTQSTSVVQAQGPVPVPVLPMPDIQIIVAGGYDVHCVENVEYRAELGRLAVDLNIEVTFLLSISDAARTDLLRTATAVVYTPENEHFGIVPLEAMYAGTPVVAVRSGGPLETILDGETGFLCDPTAESFGRAMAKLLLLQPVQDPDSDSDPKDHHRHHQTARAMGIAARQHVKDRFGKDRLQKEWKELLEETQILGRQRMAGRRNNRNYRLVSAPRHLIYVVEAVVTLMVCLVLTAILRRLGIVEPSASIWSTVRNAIGRDEL